MTTVARIASAAAAHGRSHSVRHSQSSSPRRTVMANKMAGPSKRNSSLPRQWGPEKKVIHSTKTTPFITTTDLNDLLRMFDDFHAVDVPKRRHKGALSTDHLSHFPVDVVQNNAEYLLTAELPGFCDEDVSLRIDDKTLTISASKYFDNKNEDGDMPDENADDNIKVLRTERRLTRSFQRSFTLPKDVDEAAISAAMEHGVLFLTMPRIIDGPTSRTIKVQKGLANKAETHYEKVKKNGHV